MAGFAQARIKAFAVPAPGGGGGLMDCSFRPFDLHVIFFLKGHGIFLRIFIVEILECCVGG
jgi:hypothetical protein